MTIRKYTKKFVIVLTWLAILVLMTGCSSENEKDGYYEGDPAEYGYYEGDSSEYEYYEGDPSDYEYYEGDLPEYDGFYGDDWGDPPYYEWEEGDPGEEEYVQESIGLAFEPTDYGRSYAVTGMGTCRDDNIVIPAWYDGKPVTMIGNKAFSDTWITSVTIPYSITDYGKQIFDNCPLLTDINVYSEADFNSSGLGSVPALKNIFYYVRYVPKYTGAKTDSPVDIHISGDAIEITASAFGWQNIGSIDIAPGLMKIGAHAFDNSPIRTIELPDTLMSIGKYAFNQSSLEYIVLPDSVRVVGEAAFMECRDMTYAVLSAGMTEVPVHMLCHCMKLSEVTLPASITALRTYAMYTSENLKTVNVLGSLKVIEHGALACTAIEHFELPDTVTTLGTYAFSSCPYLRSLRLPSGLTEIPEGLCFYSGLTSITIPSGVRSLGEDAFYKCEYLTEVNNMSPYVSTADPAFTESPCYTGK